MSARGEGGVQNRVRSARSVRALIPVLLLALTALTLSAGAACGDSSGSQLAGYLGTWQRVVGGEPDPSLTLLVTQSERGVTLTFADVSGARFEGAAILSDGSLVSDVPVDIGAGAAAGLSLSLDGGVQLVVDRVLDDGTTEPVWVYERASSPAPAAGP